jgi:hypothetical protein
MRVPSKLLTLLSPPLAGLPMPSRPTTRFPIHQSVSYSHPCGPLQSVIFRSRVSGRSNDWRCTTTRCYLAKRTLRGRTLRSLGYTALQVRLSGGKCASRDAEDREREEDQALVLVIGFSTWQSRNSSIGSRTDHVRGSTIDDRPKTTAVIAVDDPSERILG